MAVRIAQEFGLPPHEVAGWPLHYYVRVREALLLQWTDKKRSFRFMRQKLEESREPKV